MNNKTTLSYPKTALVAAMLLELTTHANAATINVDNNTCTLANAIESANQDSVFGTCTAGDGEDVINLPQDSEISLSEALPPIINDVTINANDSIISRDANAQGQFSLIQVGSPLYLANLPTLTLNDVTLSGGDRNGNYGGGIFTTNSSLILNNSTVTNSMGGGITLSSNNDSEINNSVISNNQSSPSGVGNYYGGALSVNSGVLTVTNTTIANNSSSSGIGGGGVYVSNYGGAVTLNITNSTISGNTTTFEGAGIFHYDFNKLNNSNISITSSTIVNNQAGESGGGIHNDVADFVIKQSIISGNSTGSDGAEINSTGGSFTLDDYNLIGLNGDNGSTGITIGSTDIVPTESILSDIINTALANNGSNTPTHDLVINSPAIDAIDGNCAQPTDQVGNSRPVDGDGDMTAACDIGAIEYQPVIDLIFADGFDPEITL